MDAVFDGLDEGVLLVDADWQVVRANAPARDLLGRDPRHAPVVDAFPESVEATFERRFADRRPAAVAFEEYYPEIETWLAVRTRPLDGDPDGEGRDGAAYVMAVYLRDVTARRDRRRTLESHEAALATVDRLLEIVSELVASMAGAPDRESVEGTVVERLVETELYDTAVVLAAAADGGGLDRRAAAGSDDVVAALTAAADDGLEAAALDAGDPVVSRSLAADDRLPQAVRRSGFAHGVQCGLAVPIAHDAATYGVLGVYTDRPEAFGERERAGFATLARTAGLAVGAARRRRLLLSDTVVELTLRVTAGTDPFVAASTRGDYTVAVDGMVPVEGGLVCYVSVEGAAPSTATAALEGPGLSVARVVDAGEADGLLEVEVATGAGALAAVTARGGSVREATFAAGTGRLTVELPPGTDVRAFLDAVTDAVPETELVAKRQREREIETAGEFRRDLRGRLTDRQYAVLEAARLANYFQSPRGSNAGEVASALDITAPTFHHHLRAAERKLVEAFFGDEPVTETVDRLDAATTDDPS